MNRYYIEPLPNGLTRIFDRVTLLKGLYYTSTGKYHSGDLRRFNLKEFTR